MDVLWEIPRRSTKTLLSKKITKSNKKNNGTRFESDQVNKYIVSKSQTIKKRHGMLLKKK